MSAPDYQLIDDPRYPHVTDDYRRSFGVVRTLDCDLLLTPHSDASGWAPADRAAPDPAPMSCRAYADKTEGNFDMQLDAERKERH